MTPGCTAESAREDQTEVNIRCPKRAGKRRRPNVQHPGRFGHEPGLTSQDHPCRQQSGLFQARPPGPQTPEEAGSQAMTTRRPTGTLDSQRPITTPSTKTRSQGIWRMTGPSAPQLPGVYQIGLVYARSCVDVGAPSGNGIPKRNASYVDHLGVGISITRA